MQPKNKQLNTTSLTGPLQYLTKESTRWDDKAMRVLCVWLMINAAVCLKSDARRAPRVRARRAKSELLLDFDPQPELLTPGDKIRGLKAGLDSLLRDSSYQRQRRLRERKYYRRLRISQKHNLSLNY